MKKLLAVIGFLITAASPAIAEPCIYPGTLDMGWQPWIRPAGYDKFNEVSVISARDRGLTIERVMEIAANTCLNRQVYAGISPEGQTYLVEYAPNGVFPTDLASADMRPWFDMLVQQAAGYRPSGTGK